MKNIEIIGSVVAAVAAVGAVIVVYKNIEFYRYKTKYFDPTTPMTSASIDEYNKKSKTLDTINSISVPIILIGTSLTLIPMFKTK